MARRQSGRDGAGLDPVERSGRDVAAHSPGQWRQYATGGRRRGVRDLPAGEGRRPRAAVGRSARGAVSRIPAVATAAPACQPPAIAFYDVDTSTGSWPGLALATSIFLRPILT